MTEKIRLTGRVIEWDAEEDSDDHTITASEAGTYEANGYSVFEFQGTLHATKIIPFSDGTIQLQPNLDRQGRFAVAGGHANYGYSGYFKAYVCLNGKRKNLVDFWTLFPAQEHHYSSQQNKGEAEARIKAVIQGRAGTDVVKVARGYAFDPVAHAERQNQKEE